MKKIMQRFFGVLTSVALLVTSATPVFADSHAHHAGENTLDGPSDGYTITLTVPDGYKVTEGKNPTFGAYQIFSGKVKDDPDLDGTSVDYTNPGTDGISIPITDIKWGNAFCSAGKG